MGPPPPSRSLPPGPLPGAAGALLCNPSQPWLVQPSFPCGSSSHLDCLLHAPLLSQLLPLLPALPRLALPSHQPSPILPLYPSQTLHTPGAPKVRSPPPGISPPPQFSSQAFPLLR